MLTRLKVNGFKNLVDVEVRFGPFTCIAGANGVGKSNLFDAIQFLSSLADKPLMEAALSVRDDSASSGDIRGLFHRVGDEYARLIEFEVEMIVPESGEDDLGQEATASTTFLRYSLSLGYRESGALRSVGALEILREELHYINIRDAGKYLLFPHSAAWRRSVLAGRRTAPLISTETASDGKAIILRHQDGGSSGKPARISASSLPRTVVSASNAAESPTALLARREMQSWRLLQLEPTSLRKADAFTSPQRLGTDGSHLPATIFRLAHTSDPEAIYSRISNRLTELVEDVQGISVAVDPQRESLTLELVGWDQTVHSGRSLSDGTLRFLALVTLELDPLERGLLCLEEPENGMHPARIPAILRLLQDLAVDTVEPIGEENPLRQVIVNTHSPTVVAHVPEDSLVIADTVQRMNSGATGYHGVIAFKHMSDTWRSKASEDNVIAPGKLLPFLNPINGEDSESQNGDDPANRVRIRRVLDRPDMQMLLPFPEASP